MEEGKCELMEDRDGALLIFNHQCLSESKHMTYFLSE